MIPLTDLSMLPSRFSRYLRSLSDASLNLLPPPVSLETTLADILINKLVTYQPTPSVHSLNCSNILLRIVKNTAKKRDSKRNDMRIYFFLLCLQYAPRSLKGISNISIITIIFPLDIIID